MRALLGILLIVIVACDSKATATDKAGGARAEQKSKEYESCGASMQCLDELRCFVDRMTVSELGGASARDIAEHFDVPEEVAVVAARLLIADE